MQGRILWGAFKHDSILVKIKSDADLSLNQVSVAPKRYPRQNQDDCLVKGIGVDMWARKSPGSSAYNNPGRVRPSGRQIY
jgi:hypothetical protein